MTAGVRSVWLAEVEFSDASAGVSVVSTGSSVCGEQPSQAMTSISPAPSAPASALPSAVSLGRVSLTVKVVSDAGLLPMWWCDGGESGGCDLCVCVWGG